MEQSQYDSSLFGIPSATVYRVRAVAALLQLLVILLYGIVTVALGPRPESTEEAFRVFQESPLAGFLRGDLPLLILVSLYLGTFPALYLSLKRLAPFTVTVAFFATVIAVVIGFTNESSFSLYHLARQYSAATLENNRAALISAGEAVIAGGWWNSTCSYISGFLLQGAGVVISLVMLRSKSFNKVTAIAGLAGNGFDLIQHLLEPFLPGINAMFAPVMGPFYLIWFPMLAWDFTKLGNRSQSNSA